MNNRQVAHAWANQNITTGKGSSFYFDGPRLYSYGRHFCVGQIVTLPDGPHAGRMIALMNGNKRSITTSKHCSYARSAASHLTQITINDPDAVFTSWADVQAAVEKWTADTVRAAADEKAAKKEAAARRRAQIKGENAAKANYLSELEAWRKGGPQPATWLLRLPGYNSSYASLRVAADGKRIETSRGAEIPVKIARHVWPLLLTAENSENAKPEESRTHWHPFFEVPDFSWGVFTGLALRRVARGSGTEMRVGCHSILWTEIAYIAQALGLIESSQSAAS